MHRPIMIVAAALAVAGCQGQHAADQAKIKDLEGRLAAAEQRASAAEAMSQHVTATASTDDRERALAQADRAASAQEQRAGGDGSMNVSAADVAALAKTEALSH